MTRPVAGEAGGGQREERLDNLLAAFAPQMAKIAATRCRGGFIDPGACAWYHGIWPYLRSLGVVSSPVWHRDFYAKALRTTLEDAASPSARVLISGTADFSMLEQVFFSADALHRGADRVAVTVLDRCATPLEACRWYADQFGRAITVEQAGLFEFAEASEPYDVVTTDAFLTRFSREQAASVIAAWHSLLRVGGSVVTTVRIHEPMECLPDEVDGASEFVDRVEKRAACHESDIFLDVAPIVAGAKQYASLMRSTDLGGEDAVLQLFRDRGFDVVCQERALVAGELRPVEYLRIAARKY